MVRHAATETPCCLPRARCGASRGVQIVNTTGQIVLYVCSRVFESCQRCRADCMFRDKARLRTATVLLPAALDLLAAAPTSSPHKVDSPTLASHSLLINH